MKNGNWIPLHTGVKKWLPYKGRYSKLEALISHTLDVDAKNTWTVAGYAALWGWSRNKVRKFINDLHEKGQQKDSKRTVKGQCVTIKYNNLHDLKDSKRTAKGQQKDTTIHPHPHPHTNTNKRFTKPKIQEIKEYCQERGNNIDPVYFYDSNESKGWVVGKTKTPMKDWKATIRTWERNDKQRNAKKTGGIEKFQRKMEAQYGRKGINHDF